MVARIRRRGVKVRFAWRGAVAAIAVAAAVQPAIGEATMYQPEYVRERAYSQGSADQLAVTIDHLTAFLPDRWGDFILPWKSLAWQVDEGIGVGPSYFRELSDGRRLLWGCRRHSCDEKAAVVMSPDGKVEAAALIHFRCHFSASPVRRSNSWRKSNYNCDIDRRTLTVFVHVTQTYRPDFERWAEAVTGEKLPVEIYWV